MTQQSRIANSRAGFKCYFLYSFRFSTAFPQPGAVSVPGPSRRYPRTVEKLLGNYTTAGPFVHDASLPLIASLDLHNTR